MSQFDFILAKADEIQKAILDSGYFDKDLEGACAIASVELFKFGKRHNLPIHFAYNELWHCFNLVGEGKEYILDITVSQFNGDYMHKVAFEPFEQFKTRYYWKIDGYAETLEEFEKLAREKLEFDKRWFSQNPNIYRFINENNKVIFTQNLKD